MVSVGLGLSLCLLYGRSRHSSAVVVSSGRQSKAVVGSCHSLAAIVDSSEAVADSCDLNDGTNVKVYQVPVTVDLSDERSIVTWLSIVINNIDNEIVGRKPELRNVLTKLCDKLNTHKKKLNKRRVGFDGDGDDTVDIEEPMITSLIEHLTEILAP